MLVVYNVLAMNLVISILLINDAQLCFLLYCNACHVNILLHLDAIISTLNVTLQCIVSLLPCDCTLCSAEAVQWNLSIMVTLGTGPK